MVRNYSLLILLAEFGIWESFFNVFQEYLYPLGNVLRDFLGSTIILNIPDISSYTLSHFSSSSLPILLGILMAIPTWLRTKRIVRETHVPKIQQSMDILDAKIKKRRIGEE